MASRRVLLSTALLVLICAPGLALAQSPQPPQPPPAPPPAAERDQAPSIRQNVTLVDVLFSVFNNRNRIVADLEKENFKVYDDGMQQEIRFFSRQTNLPLRVGLLLDTSNSIRDRLRFEQQAAVDFLFNAIRPGKDQAFLMTVDDQPEVIQPFTGDLPRLSEAIMKLRAGGGTALYDAIYHACEELARVPSPEGDAAHDMRRVLVVIGDGVDNLSSHSRSETLDMAQRAGIVIYAISSSTSWVITDQQTNSSNSINRKWQKDEGDHVLEQFSKDSGGRVFFPYRIDDLAQSFHDIGEELRSQYSLAYAPAGRTPDKKFHSIRITVDQKNLEVHARKGYYANPPARQVSQDVPPARPGL